MRDLMADDAPSVIGLFTIRSDNYERLQLAKELDGVRQVTLQPAADAKGAYAEVIKGPAKRLEGTARALKVDDALVQALLTDIEAGGAKDSLPLLAFTLERLYSEYVAAAISRPSTMIGSAASRARSRRRSSRHSRQATPIPRSRGIARRVWRCCAAA